MPCSPPVQWSVHGTRANPYDVTVAGAPCDGCCTTKDLERNRRAEAKQAWTTLTTARRAAAWLPTQPVVRTGCMTLVIAAPLTACMACLMSPPQPTLKINCQIGLLTNLMSTDRIARSTTRMTTTCSFDVRSGLLAMRPSLRRQSRRIRVHPTRPGFTKSPMRESPAHAAPSKNTKARPRGARVIAFMAPSRDLMRRPGSLSV